MGYKLLSLCILVKLIIALYSNMLYPENTNAAVRFSKESAAFVKPEMEAAMASTAVMTP